MRIHKEGTAIILGVLIFFMVLYILIAYYTNCNAVYCNSIGITGVLFLSFILFFFRNPARRISVDQSIVFAPADGKIIAIEEVFETEFLNRKCIKVSIFMSIWNIHVNRYPISGQIIYTKYHPGKYLIAHHPKSSELNEHQTVVIEKQGGFEIMVKQIAGAIARRVVCYAKEGENVTQGEDLGFIKFGSRVDLFLPLNTEILVKMNEKVKGNKTMIARFNS
ncbi:MAG: phosphatidylserine decarboxylase family protein [Bacteroidales bacterium]